MNLAEMTFRRKSIIWFLLVCMVVGGILAFDKISKLEDPELVVMMSQIVTLYPGATAHEVEMQVTNIIEEELSTPGRCGIDPLKVDGQRFDNFGHARIIGASGRN
jgi:multidrug efflux pump subunit AcrB